LNERHPYPQARWHCSVTASVRFDSDALPRRLPQPCPGRGCLLTVHS